jgi:hypothetical protein
MNVLKTLKVTQKLHTTFEHTQTIDSIGNLSTSVLSGDKAVNASPCAIKLVYGLLIQRCSSSIYAEALIKPSPKYGCLLLFIAR